MKETWKRYKDTYYLISDLGNVWSERYDRALSPIKQRYLTIDMRHNGSKFKASVHRMVAETFIPNPDNKPYVNHIDGNKHNNAVSNLEWVTASENSFHAVEAGLSPVGEQKTLAKLTDADVVEIHNLQKSGIMLDRDIAIKFNVTSGVITAIRQNKTWKHIKRERLPDAGPNRVKKLSAEDIPNIRQMFIDGKSDADIGRIYNVARGTINQIRQGKTWRNY
jgi:hypothetical protein